MTITANSRNGRTRSTNCLVASVIDSRRPEHRALGYRYAMFKLPGEDKATRGFLFKRNCGLPIDEGFEFDEKELIIYDERLRSSRVKDEFYPPIDEVPEFAAAALQEDGIYPDLDRVQDLPYTPRKAQPAALVPTVGMSVEQLWQFLSEEDKADLKRQLAYTIIAAKAMGVTQAAMWSQATSLAGVHFIPSFDPRYKDSLR